MQDGAMSVFNMLRVFDLATPLAQVIYMQKGGACAAPKSFQGISEYNFLCIPWSGPRAHVKTESIALVIAPADSPLHWFRMMGRCRNVTTITTP